MATLTTNYQLKKPATTDPVSIADINDNMDIIDNQIKTNADLISNMVPKTGGTMTGNLKVGSASIGTNGYIQGTWLQTTASINLGNAPPAYPALSGGWIYSRTADEMKSDLGIKNITISTSDPSGGSSGDIWIKYS